MATSDYFLYRGGKFIGPFNADVLNDMVARGEARPSDSCMSSSKPDVQTVADALGLPVTQKIDFRKLAPGTPRRHGHAAPPRNRGVFIILGLLLGGFGAHNFYAGYHDRGAAQCVAWIAGCGVAVAVPQSLFIAALVLVWVIVELCIVTEDAAGQPMY
jgi:TM2 domain-containing membrane protein YozV